MKMKICCWLAPIIISTSVIAADNNSAITQDSFQGSRGRIAINQASGDQNLQSNIHVIGPQISLEHKQEIISEKKYKRDDRSMASSVIENKAFAEAQGIISVNQVAGADNMQANLGAIAFTTGVSMTLTDDALGLVSGSDPAVLPTDQSGNNQAEISRGNFVNSRGVVQINQISGDSNVTTNQFSLQFPGGN
ncbi:MAG: hypothetical protein ACI86X_000857 [Moritella sp.]|jgi:hypothetical protein